MKKIGHQTFFITTSKFNPRNGEATFARLKDGRICHAFTEYYSEEWDDHGTARISACFSADEGESWTAPEILVEMDEKAQNYMSPSLFRLPNGELGIVYLRKEVTEQGCVTCMPWFRSSFDEGKSWSEPVLCTDELGYYCAINDGCTVDSLGRIWVPLAYHGECFDAFGTSGFGYNRFKSGVVQFAVSDDCGRNWRRLDVNIESPFNDNVGFAEPGIHEYDDGSLWMYCRTNYGFQYQSFSRDRGESWTPAEPNFMFMAPDSPMRVRRVENMTLAVFNPRSFCHVGQNRETMNGIRRTPILCAVSYDGGKSFDATAKTFVDQAFRDFEDNCYMLEDDERDSYCYPAVFGVKDGFLVSYYHSNGTDRRLNCTKITKVNFDEIG